MTQKQNFQNRRTEKAVAVGSFLAAVAFAFVSLYLSKDYEVAAGNCSVVAQFLILTASLFGIDYKLNSHGTSRAVKSDTSIADETL